MKFKGNGIVWNPKKNQMLCRFKDGYLDTDDKEIIETLRNLGYESEDEEETVVSEPEEDCAADNGPDTLPVPETDEAENTVPEPEKTEEAPKKEKPKNTGSSKTGKKK